MSQGKHAGGDGFGVEIDKLEDFAKRWDDLANEYRDDSIDLGYLPALSPPGLEYVSANSTEVIRESVGSLIDTMTRHEAYCRDQAEKFRNAASKYHGGEAGHSAAIQAIDKH